MSKEPISMEGLVEPGGCEQHPTAGRVGNYCLSCVIIPAPSGVDVDVNALLRQAARDGDQERLTVDTITSDALDALYDRLERARDAAALHRQGLLTTAELYAVIEAGPAAVEAAEPIHCPCDGTHFPSPENCQWCKCHRAWTPPPPGDTWEATVRAAVTHSDGSHLYLSTGCLHDDHDYCKSMTGLNGAKRPGECKHCGARCICACHTVPGRS